MRKVEKECRHFNGSTVARPPSSHKYLWHGRVPPTHLHIAKIAKLLHTLNIAPLALHWVHVRITMKIFTKKRVVLALGLMLAAAAGGVTGAVAAGAAVRGRHH